MTSKFLLKLCGFYLFGYVRKFIKSTKKYKQKTNEEKVMAEIREKCLYSKSHEWVRVEGHTAVCGIDDFAQSNAGELVFIEFPELNDEVKAGDDVCVIESVKAASDVYAPVSGTIVEINEALINSPLIVNKACYDDGWLFKIKMNDLSELDNLLSADEYVDEFDS